MTKLNPDGKNAKRRNHTVPRSLLCQWAVTETTRKTIHYIDCNDGSQKFEIGEKANFAVQEYQYVPIGTNGFRDETMENWFSPDESALITLARETTAGTFGQSMSAAQKGKAIRACIALGYRSHYEFDKMTELAASRDPQATSEVIQRAIISHFWFIYGHKFQQFKNWDFTIFHSLPEKLFICDRPLFDGTVHKDPVDMIAIPISPNAFLMGMPAEDPSAHGTLFWRNGSTSTLANFMNHHAMMRAREFLVGDPVQLAGVIDEMSQSKIHDRKSLDRFVLKKLRLNSLLTVD
jgi:hypothetical protein